MPIPFLSSIGLNKNEVQDFKVFNLASDPTLTSGGDFGYFWLNTSGAKNLKFWDGANIRSLIDSTTIGSATAGLATDLAGGGAGQVVYQDGVNDTKFLAAGTAGQVLSSNGSSAPSWLNQSSITAGSVANALTAGTYLTSGGTYDGSVARTFAVDATNANTSSKIVARDAYGNFSAGTITAALSGNATTATTATNVSGGTSGALLYQSATNFTTNLSLGGAGQVLKVNTGATAPEWVDQSTLSVGSATTATTANAVANALTAGTYLTSGGTYNGSVARTFAVDATSANTASKVVARDASGNFAAGTITAATVTGLSAPTLGSDATNKDYVDGVVQGLDIKASCLVATTTDITLSAPGAITIDGVVASTDFTTGVTRILVKDQSAQAENGIYIWQGPAAAMTRSADANTWDELVAAFTFVERGTANADSGWVCNVNAGGTLGTTAVTWTKFSQAGSYTAGNGMVLSGGAFSFAQSSAYTAGRIPFASSTSAIGFSSNLFWDNSNNRLGIGTATPLFALDIRSGSIYAERSTNPTNGALIQVSNQTTSSNNGCKLSLDAYNIGACGLGVPSGAQALAFYVGGIADANEKARIDTNGYLYTASNGRIGVGVVPTIGPLDVQANTAATAISIRGRVSANVGTLRWFNNDGVTEKAAIESYDGGFEIRTLTSAPHIFIINSSEKMRLDTSGNLGLGVTPKAWAAGYKAIQVGSYSSVQDVSGFTIIGCNYYNDGQDKSLNGGAVSRYLQNGGAHTWQRVASSTANNPISFTDSMVLDASGNLGVGTASASGKLHVEHPSTVNTVLKNSGSGVDIRSYAGTSIGTFGTYSNHSLSIFTNDTIRATFDTSGNLGLGVTPSAWVGGRAFDIGSSGSLFGDGLSYDWRVGISTGAYRSGSPTSWYYKTTGQSAGAYQIWSSSSSGVTHAWYSAASGTAGNAISFTQAMTLDASGRLLLGTASNVGTEVARFYNSSATRVRVDQASNGLILGADSSGPFLDTSGSNRLAFFVSGTQTLTLKTTGQINLGGLAADPAGAAGDLYYSTGNYFKWHNGTSWQTFPRKYSTALSSTGTSFTVTHNLGTRDVTVMVRKSGSTYDQVYTDVQMTDTNTVTVIFASSVTGSDYTVTVIG